MSKQNNKLIAIVGPTASGKTALAIQLAEKYNGEIICADSRTIYKDLNIGTAKPNLQEQAEIRHHLLDIIEPNESFNAAEFTTLCRKYVSDIQKAGKVPFIVGGTGLYIDAFLFGYRFRSNSSSLDLTNMSQEQKTELAATMYPSEFEKIDGKNNRRIEQLLTRGPAQQSDRNLLKYDCLIIGLQPDMLTLKHNIAQRTEYMLNNGLVQETKYMRKKYGDNIPAFHTIGYKETLQYLNGDLNKVELAENINRSTYQLARRQITWFKRNKAIIWINQPKEALNYVKQYVSSDATI